MLLLLVLLLVISDCDEQGWRMMEGTGTKGNVSMTMMWTICAVEEVY